MVRATTVASLLALSQYASAFPSMPKGHPNMPKRDLGKRQTGFDAEAQLIDVSGDHEFSPPGSGDQRGPCPGLNALANHNYIPHNGVATIQQFVDQTNAVFGMGTDLGTFLSVYGAVFDGDLTSWSIGGSPGGSLLPGLLSAPQGLRGSHNKYETDGSPTRGDLYLNGDNSRLQIDQFQQLYDTQSGVSNDDANYDLDILTQFRADRVAASKANNPYFFSAPFSGILVQPAAYTFIYRFMSNKSAENPEGVLNKEVLKSFFSISGDDDALTYTAGNERIPENWYKRAIGDEYTIGFYETDLLAAALQHPEFLEVGGNTGTPGSFVGVDPANLTGGVFNADTLLEGNNLACFGFEAAIQQGPDFLQGVLSDVTGAISQVSDALGGTLSALSCPQLDTFDDGPLQQFPGFTDLNSDGSY